MVLTYSTYFQDLQCEQLKCLAVLTNLIKCLTWVYPKLVQFKLGNTPARGACQSHLRLGLDPPFPSTTHSHKNTQKTDTYRVSPYTIMLDDWPSGSYGYSDSKIK